MIFWLSAWHSHPYAVIAKFGHRVMAFFCRANEKLTKQHAYVVALPPTTTRIIHAAHLNYRTTCGGHPRGRACMRGHAPRTMVLYAVKPDHP